MLVWSRAQADPAAFAHLYDRYVQPIYWFCYRRLGGVQAAEDATSATFVRALAALPRFDPKGGSVRSWLFTIAHNVVLDCVRQAARRPNKSLDLVAELMAQAGVPAGVTAMPNGFAPRPGQSTDSARVRLTSWRETRGRLWGLAELAAVAALILVFLGGAFGDGPFGGLNSVWQQTDEGSGEVGLYRGNAARTGVSTDPGPSGIPELKWRERFHGIGVFETGVAANGRIYLPQDQRGEVIAVDAETGDLIWTATVGKIASSPPAVGNGMVYVATAGRNYGGGNTGYLIALDAATGAERWRVQTGGSVGSSPALDGETVYVYSSDRMLRALNAQTGQERWSVDVGPDWITSEMLETWYPPTSSPAVADGVVYTSDYLGSLLALDAGDGHELWRFKTDAEVIYTPVVSAGTVYFINSDSWLSAVDTATGQERWRKDLFQPGQIVPTVADGLIFLGTTNNMAISVLDATTGETVWRYPILGQLTNVTYAQGTVFASAGDGNVYAFDAQRGRIRWRADTGNSRILEPFIADDVLVVPARDGNVYTLKSGPDVATPSARQFVDISGMPPCNPRRSLTDGHLEGTPTATLFPNRAPAEFGLPQIQPGEIPTGSAASEETKDGIEATLLEMASCDYEIASPSSRSFYSGDYLRRPTADWNDEFLMYMNTGLILDADYGPLLTVDDARDLPDGRVGVVVDRGNQPGELAIFTEVDGVWLIDERYEIVPALGING